MHYFFAGGAKRCLKYFCLFPPRMIYFAGKRMGEEPMKTMTVSRAAAICGGRVTQYSDAPIGRAIIDSRQVQPGDMFVAYRGENVDGHRFIAKALEAGAACCLAEYLPEGV